MSPRYQSLIRRLMAVLLVVAVVAGSPLTKATLTPSAARASTFCPQSSSQIVQCNALGENFYTGIERPLIDDILQTYDLPPTDSDRLLSWQRDMVRASVFAELVSIINTPADQRTVDEQTAVNDLASLVELQRWKAASDAKQEYNTWAANPCGYNPPGPFAGTYDVYDYCNSSQIAFGPPFPPTLQDFEHYGVYLANRDYYTNPGLSGISQGGAYALGLLGGAVAAGAAAGTLALVPDVSSALTAAIFPYHFAISFTTTASGEIVAAPEALAVSGAELAGPAAVLILAVTSIILGSIEISANEQIPAELDQGIAAAQSPVDLAGLLKSKQGTQEVWMAFIRTTMPGYNTSQPDTVDFPHSVPAPAYTATDRKFKIFAPDGSATETGQLTYLDWAGHQQTAWLDGGWFVVEDSDHNLSLSLSIQVLAGSIFYVVNRHGDDFFYVDQNGDTGLGLPPTAFNYRSWTGETDEAHLAPPDGTPPYIDVTAVTTDGAGDAVPYILGTTATEDVTLTFTCGDADGPDDIAVCPAPMTFHGPISTTVRVWASDYSGNVENNVLGQVIIWPNGYNPPTISASATTEDGQPYVAGTWTDQTVTVHYDCEDPVSGVLSCSSDHVFADEGIASASGAVVANSNFDNTTTFGPVQIDKTPPTINASAKTADGNAYVAGTWTNQPVTVRYDCSDALSGIASGGCQEDQAVGTDGITEWAL
ncbi:MAG TPA: hypothetical protein VFI42_10910, partial [Thermomicrobiaceae bacterium]|nr:hypothetical protein [Thermomicrobiaceae bacterium]